MPWPSSAISLASQRFSRIRPSVSSFYQPGLASDTGIAVLRDHETGTLIALTREEELVVNILRLIKAPVLAEEVRDLCMRKYAVELSLEGIQAIAERLQSMALLEPNDGSLTDNTDIIDIKALQIRARRRVLEVEQLARLRTMLQRLCREVPYYQDSLRGRDIELTSLNQLRDLPIITKEEIRRNLMRLMPADHSRFSVEWRSTSGTTGERLQAAHSGSYMRQSMADVFHMNPFFYRQAVDLPWCALTTPLCSGTECHMEMSLSYEDRLIRNKLFGPNGLILNSVNSPTQFTNDKLDAIIAEMQRHDARYLRCNSWYALPLALRVLETRPSLPRMEGIIITYEVSSEIHKRVISRAFDCPLFESYGSNECGDLAFEVEEGGLAVPHNAAIIEILDKQGRSVPPGGTGRVYVTTLQKHSMPLLRYQTTDLARAAREPDRRPEYTIESIEGRIADMITKPDRKPVTPRMLDAVISEVADGFGWYQLVQTGSSSYRLQLVPVAGYSDDNTKAVSDALRDFFDADISLSVNTTKEIMPSSSGKFRICYQAPGSNHMAAISRAELPDWVVTEEWF